MTILYKYDNINVILRNRSPESVVSVSLTGEALKTEIQRRINDAVKHILLNLCLRIQNSVLS